MEEKRVLVIDRERGFIQGETRKVAMVNSYEAFAA